MDRRAIRVFQEYDRGRISRRQLLQALGVAGLAAPVAATFGLGSSTALAQGRCRDGYQTQNCPLDEATATKAIPPAFEPTGWNTASLDHLTFRVADYKSEAAFYIALMGWTLRNDDGQQAVLDIGNWGTAVFKQGSPQPPSAAAAAAPATGRGRGRGPSNTVVESFCFEITPWNAKTVESELRKRDLSPVPDNDGKGFESFHVSDPDGFDLQISNGGGYTKARKTSKASAKLSQAAPFEATGWQTVWLDHLSFSVTNYKQSASFYSNLLGWKPTYDEGSQNELMIGEVGDVIVRGGNAFDPSFNPSGRGARIDHISFGIAPWDTDGVKAELEKRGLPASVDTSTLDDIHVAAFKSYHTRTPNGYNLQISYVTHDNRLALSNAVRPKKSGD